MASTSVKFTPYKIPKSGQVLRNFVASLAFIRAIMGPMGSGKTSCAIAEIFTKSMQQKPHEGVRKSRFGVVRKTYRDLERTTIPTFKQ